MEQTTCPPKARVRIVGDKINNLFKSQEPLISETHLGPANPCSSAHDETAVHRDGLASHVAGSIAAEPKDRIRNLLRAADPSHRNTVFHCLERIALAAGHHLVGHRCPD